MKAPPISKYGEMRCYIRDPDCNIVEAGRAPITYC